METGISSGCMALGLCADLPLPCIYAINDMQLLISYFLLLIHFYCTIHGMQGLELKVY